VTNLLDESVAWDAASRRELLHAVDEETDRLNRLVGNLLEMTRIEAGALHLTRSSQDIAEVIAAVVERLQPRLSNRPLMIELPPELPLVQISYTQIDQVLTNLIENAAKYTPDGTAITVRASAVAGEVRVEVCDQGPGIPEGMRTRIFEKFVRAIGPERHADGAGLGLAICKGIVEAHGGKIWAENLASGGARFVFTLPTRADTPPPAATLEPVSVEEDRS
jgi:two-component system sensor histidine kinase KdpD